jgi:hypothetical protein
MPGFFRGRVWLLACFCAAAPSEICAGAEASSGPKSASTSRGAYAPGSFMTKSTSPAAGMVMGSKYTYDETRRFLTAHPVTSLRDDSSNAAFGLHLGSQEYSVKGTGYEVTSSGGPTVVSAKGTMVTANGLRVGANLDQGDFSYKRNLKIAGTNSSRNIRNSLQHIGFFAAAGLTPGFGASLALTMVDVKQGDDHETANIISPGVMVMMEKSEFVFDIGQSDKDTGIEGHWRLAMIHNLGQGLFATGELARMKPYAGDDYWRFAGGARLRSSSHSSMGAEFLFSQEWFRNDVCFLPTTVGVRGDIDHELAADKVVSVGGEMLQGNCTTESDRKLSKTDLFLTGSFKLFL